MEATATHDVWALAVVAFEATARRPPFQSVAEAFACAAGRHPYLWEAAAAAPAAWRDAALRPLLSRCLVDDSTQCPSAAVFRAQLRVVADSLREAARDGGGRPAGVDG